MDGQIDRNADGKIDINIDGQKDGKIDKQIIKYNDQYIIILASFDSTLAILKLQIERQLDGEIQIDKQIDAYKD